ncbi:MAG: DUF5317 family protein [Solirubrobacterales bacterium]
MFIQIIVLALVIGIIFKGSLRNLSNFKLQGIYFVIAAFLLEAVVIMTVRKGIIQIGIVTLLSDIVMYSLLIVFVYKNRREPLIYIVGIGFLLNAVAIFANGGTMPVALNAVHAAGLTENVGTMGLYKLVGTDTKFWFLGDIIPYTFLNKNILSVGDLILSLGIMLIIIKGMCTKNIEKYKGLD